MKFGPNASRRHGPRWTGENADVQDEQQGETGAAGSSGEADDTSNSDVSEDTAVVDDTDEDEDEGEDPGSEDEGEDPGSEDEGEDPGSEDEGEDPGSEDEGEDPGSEDEGEDAGSEEENEDGSGSENGEQDGGGGAGHPLPPGPPTPPHVMARIRKQVLERVARREITMADASRLLRCSRSRVYELRRCYQRDGETGLLPKPRYPEPISPHLRDAVISYAVGHPGEGPRSIAGHLRETRFGGKQISASSVYTVLRAAGLHQARLRQAAAAALATAAHGGPVTDRMVRELFKVPARSAA